MLIPKKEDARPSQAYKTLIGVESDMAQANWSEEQIKVCVSAYFDLLDAQDRGEERNKSELYRRLSAKFPQRRPKAFERKFQNISAILYEEHLPFCDGLKPNTHYQRLLKLMVLDHLDRTHRPVQEPHEILFRKLRGLRKRGDLPIKGAGSGRFGLTLEHHLGIPPNSSKRPDFMGIELKTKHDRSLQTLFSLVPSKYSDCDDKRELLEKHGYHDTNRDRQALYTSFSNSPDSLGFFLEVRSNTIRVMRGDTLVLEYDAEAIEAALQSKHTQTVYIHVSSHDRQGRPMCRLESARYCKWPSIIRFLRLVGSGSVFLDFTLSSSNGRVRDHGFLWRVKSIALDDLYLSTEVLDLDAV